MSFNDAPSIEYQFWEFHPKIETTGNAINLTPDTGCVTHGQGCDYRSDEPMLPQTEPLKKPKVGSKGFPRVGGGGGVKTQEKNKTQIRKQPKKPRSAKFSRKIQKIS